MVLYPAADKARADEGSTSHVVAKGENLFRLSLRYGVRISSILDANGLTNPDYVEAGRVIVIPKNDSLPTTKPPESQVAAEPTPLEDKQNSTHIVQRGENLFRISLRYQVALPDLLKANNLANPDYVEAGRQLVVPAVSQPAAMVSLQPAQLTASPEPPEPNKTTSEEDEWDGTFRITYYCLYGFMSSGRWVYSGAVAADKSIFPLGKRLMIEGLGQFTVEDRFAWDAGQKRLDIWVPTCYEAVQRGVEYRQARVMQ